MYENRTTMKKEDWLTLPDVVNVPGLPLIDLDWGPDLAEDGTPLVVTIRSPTEVADE